MLIKLIKITYAIDAYIILRLEYTTAFDINYYFFSSCLYMMRNAVVKYAVKIDISIIKETINLRGF